MKTIYYTCTKAEIVSKKLNLVLSEIESSSHKTVCIVVENEHVKIQNAVNLIEHETIESAKEYQESLNFSN